MNKTLEITTAIGCPLMCTICPQKKLKQAYSGEKYLSLVTYKSILATVPKDVRIIFSGYAEPWTNPYTTQLIQHTLNEGYDIDVYTTLVGITDISYVIPLLLKYKSQLKTLCLHLPDNSNNMPGFKPSTEYNNTLKHILDSELNISMIMTMDNNQIVHNSLTNIINQSRISKWIFHTRAENTNRNETSIGVNLVDTFNNDFVVECVRNHNLTSNVVLPNGDVTLCCMDYGLKHIIGNLLSQSYNEIINGNEIKNILNSNKTLFDKKTLCRTCQDTYHRTPWNDTEIYNKVKHEYPEVIGL